MQISFLSVQFGVQSGIVALALDLVSDDVTKAVPQRTLALAGGDLFQGGHFDYLPWHVIFSLSFNVPLRFIPKG